MKIRVLGGFASELPGSNLTGFLIDGRVILDAGTISSSLDVTELRKITHVVVSHAHLDHTKGIPFLVDNVAGRASGPVVVAAAGDVIDTLRAHIFNNRIWPDFTRLPSRKSPALRFKRLAVNRATPLEGGLSFRPIRVDHTVPTTGFIIKKGGRALVYSGDTGPTSDIWKAAVRLGRELKAVLVETSFPNRMQGLADRSRHLTPETLGAELRKLGGFDGPVYVYHVKSPYLVDIEREIDALGRKDVIVVREGMEFEV